MYCGGSIRSENGDSSESSPTSRCVLADYGTEEFEMTEARGRAASVVYYNEEERRTYLWVTGGKSDTGEVLSSTEHINTDPVSTNGSDLPIPLYKHCMVSVLDQSGSKMTLVTGGVTVSSTISGINNRTEHLSGSTFFYHWITGNWTEGPILEHKRHSAACGVIHDYSTGDIAVVAGGYARMNRERMVSSVELWIVGSDEWIPGPDLPVALAESTGVRHPSGSTFVLVGGLLENKEKSNAIYKLTCHSMDCEWTKSEQSLGTARSLPVAMYVSYYFMDNMCEFEKGN